MKIDTHTKIIGRIKSVAHAKRICKARFGRLPRCGREMTVDGSEHHRTTLAHEGRGFKVWTWISVCAPHDERGRLREPVEMINAVNLPVV